MEQKYQEMNMEKDDADMIMTASESLLANLPILILGLVIILTVVLEIAA